MFKVIITLLISFCLLSIGFAGTTGKISGLVTDKNNGEPLVGVNVVVEGTFLGASTDIDGYYSILNVPAGNYSIIVNYVGYTTMTFENVRVVPDITKRLDVQMQETTIELGEEIIVTADRPFFEQSATNTVRVLDSEEIQRVPVKGVNQVVAINAGVVKADGSGGETGNAVLNVRGGRGNETLIVVDGIPQNDAMFGNAAGTIPDAAIEQISTQLGGFSAKYGAAQSGVINIVTKGGSPKYFGSLEGVSSKELDAFNYNQITGTFGGPLLPGNKTYNFFLSGEYLTSDDYRPRSIGLVIPTANIDQDVRPEMQADVLRLTGKVISNFSNDLKLTLSGNTSWEDRRQYIHTYAKNNAAHNPKIEEDVFGGSAKLSYIFDASSFIDVIGRYREQRYQRGDGVWYDDVLAYGDTSKNTFLSNNAVNVRKDENFVFWDEGRIFNLYQKYRIQTFGTDLNFTKQLEDHYIEIGGTVERDIVRYYRVSPMSMARELDTRTLEERYRAGMVNYYGYDLFGNEISDGGFRTVGADRFEEAGPKEPTTISAYIQDKIEFQDFILNFGLRWDYFDPDFRRIKDPSEVLGTDSELTEDDFEQAPVESYVSPRIGFAYPVTERTVFHAQYGIFRQKPTYFDIYDSWINLDDLESMDGQGQNLGHIQMESTTQYEFGFKNQIGEVASIDVTAFYKNIRGLINQQLIRYDAGASTKTVIGSVNSDFGTVKGLAFSFNLRKIGPLSAKIDYTLSQAEGTGSSTNSSFVAAFRNTDGITPKAIAPLEFDQTHTLTASIDIRAGADEGPSVGGVKLLENTGANFLISYNSGRPYTPLEEVNILDGQSLYGSTTQYVNTGNMPSNFRVDLKIDKRIKVGKVSLVPYLWVQNLFDTDNVIDVWGSTGEGDNTAFINTPRGQSTAQQSGNPEGWTKDYRALERDPTNYGIPRLIRLGLRLEY